MTPTPLQVKKNHLQRFIFIFLTFWSAIAKVNHFLLEILALKSYCLSASEHLGIMKLLCYSPHLNVVRLTLEIWEPITKFLVGSISSVSQVWSLILLKERWEHFQWSFFDTDTSVLFRLYNESIFIGQDWPIYMGLKLCMYIAIKQNWLQCWQYGKGLMHLRTIFRLTNLVPLGQCSTGPEEG